MRFNDIVRAMNIWLKIKHPEAGGVFICREYDEDTSIKAYKKHYIELYYRCNNKNIKVYTNVQCDRCVSECRDTYMSNIIDNALADILCKVEDIYSYGIQQLSVKS